MTCTCTHKRQIRISLQDLDRHALTWDPYQLPTAKLEHSFGTISPVMDIHGWPKHPE